MREHNTIGFRMDPIDLAPLNPNHVTMRLTKIFLSFSQPLLAATFQNAFAPTLAGTVPYFLLQLIFLFL
jgi:hypothetical protein